MLETGKSYTQEIIVGPKDTALAHGSAMVGLMENTAIHCLEGMLEPDTDTVGIEIHVQHTKATAVGKKVMCKATIVEIDGRRIRFEIEATDEKGTIGHAIHDRFIIYPEKFMSKL